MHPYKIIVAQELNQRENRKTFAENMLVIWTDGMVLMSDEARFHDFAYVNKQNVRFWPESNPSHESPL